MLLTSIMLRLGHVFNQHRTSPRIKNMQKSNIFPTKHLGDTFSIFQNDKKMAKISCSLFFFFFLKVENMTCCFVCKPSKSVQKKMQRKYFKKSSIHVLFLLANNTYDEDNFPLRGLLLTYKHVIH